MSKQQHLKPLRDQDELRSLIGSYCNLGATGQKMLAAAHPERRPEHWAAERRARKALEQRERFEQACGYLEHWAAERRARNV